ncbi:hypothetical protein T4D_5559 [Trichinella pseudospiralis]|uniref:Uncharacterized protein n=1 Tax=Trichinella pseudospiralis TaxID=6337 RepID=A0A0V1FYM8_TRIPS|nr:hypothetical protein T4D_5559 [Trichinella pseudospiralis]
MLAPAIGHGISLDGLVISAVKFRSRATWATLPLPGKSSVIILRRHRARKAFLSNTKMSLFG